ncbi:MAG: hypothetical protein AAGI24_04065 [Pseudomonadota bacterium]
MANAPFVTDPVRTAIAIAYMNEAFVADQVLPRAPVAAEEFKWVSYNKEDRYTIPDTTVDRKGELNQVEFGGTEKTDMTNDYGLKDVIPSKDVAAGQNAGIDVLGNATELLMDLILLDREQRVSSTVMNPAAYTLKESLSASDQWNTATGNPIVQISDALEVPLMRPNRMLLSSAGALALRRNPFIVQAFNGNEGQNNLVPMAFIEQLFEVQVIVGRGRYNSAKPGQTMTLTRLWSDHCVLFYQNPSAMPNRGVTFGLTAQWGQRVAATKMDDEVGLRGATVIKTGESVKEIIIAEDVAYLLENVLAA